MTYTLAEVRDKIDELADKLGSDYFQLPEILNHFRGATLEAVGEALREVEKNQEVVDDIRPLLVPGNLAVIRDPNDAGRFIAAMPVNYMRLAAYDIKYDDGSHCRRAVIKRQAEYINSLLNPNTRPTKYYPIILQENNMWQIDPGKNAVPTNMIIKYFKKPKFAKVSELDKRIVNLPDEMIEKITLATVKNMYGRTADQRVQVADAFEKTFRTVQK